MKKHLIIGLAIATLGYLCMQEALLVQDTAKATEEIDWEKYPGFREAIEKSPSNFDKAVFLRNASEIELSFTEEEKTKWDEIVNMTNELIGRVMEGLKGNAEELKEIENDKQLNVGATGMRKSVLQDELNEAAGKKMSEIGERRHKLHGQINTTLEEIRTKAKTDGEFFSLKQRFFNLKEELLLIEIAFIRVSKRAGQRELDYLKDEKYRRLFRKGWEFDHKKARLLAEKRINMDGFRKEYKKALSQLYEIYNQIKGEK